MIDTKTLAIALWCVNLVHRHGAQFAERPSDDDLIAAWIRIEWALRAAHVEVDQAVVAADRS